MHYLACWVPWIKIKKSEKEIIVNSKSGAFKTMSQQVTISLRIGFCHLLVQRKSFANFASQSWSSLKQDQSKCNCFWCHLFMLSNQIHTDLRTVCLCDVIISGSPSTANSLSGMDSDESDVRCVIWCVLLITLSSSPDGCCKTHAYNSIWTK